VFFFFFQMQLFKIHQIIFQISSCFKGPRGAEFGRAEAEC